MTQSPHDIIETPYVTEKAMTQMEWHNTLEFVVDGDATKEQIRWAIETLFNVEVASVRTKWTMQNEKHALIRLGPDDSAEEVAMEMGVF